MKGYNTGDLTRPTADYLIVDWKQADQSGTCGIGKRGLAISRVTGAPVTDEFWAHVNGTCGTPQSGVDEVRQ